MTENLLIAARNGDQDAFTAIVNRHSAMVYNTCLRRLNDPGQAQDAAQAVFILFWRKLQQLKSSVIIGGWFYRTANLVCREHIRSAIRRSKHEQNKGKAMAAKQKSKDREWTAIRPELDSAISALSRKYRDVIVLCGLENMSSAEAAQQLRIPESTVTTRLSRARDILSRKLRSKGITAGSATLVALVTQNALEAAVPQALNSAVSAGISGGGAVISSGVSAMIAGGVKAMAWIKIKLAAAALSCTLIVAAGTQIAVVMAAEEVQPIEEPIVEQVMAQPEEPPAAAPAPAVEKVERNAADIYRKALAIVKAKDDADFNRFVAATLLLPADEIRAAVAAQVDAIVACKEEVAFLAQGVASQRCEFIDDWSGGPATVIPHLAKMRHYARICALYGVMLERGGRSKEALQIYADLMVMGSQMNGDPVLISALVGKAIFDIGWERLYQLVNATENPELVKDVLVVMQRQPAPFFDVIATIKSEKKLLYDMTEQQMLHAAERGRNEFIKYFEGLQGQLTWKDKLLIPVKPEDIKAQITSGFKSVKAVFPLYYEAAGKPYLEGEQIVLAADKKFKEVSIEHSPNVIANLLKSLTPAYSRSYIESFMPEAKNASLALLCALKLQKLETGAYPEALTGVQKYFPRGLPIDPYSGEAFIYTCNGAAITVASQGPESEKDKADHSEYTFSLDTKVDNSLF